MIIILITSAVAVYIVSAIGVWNYFRIIYSEQGKWNDASPQPIDVSFVLIPFVNTVAFPLLWIVASPYKNERRGMQNVLNWIFNIKSN